jgi:hypothetical protein
MVSYLIFYAIMSLLVIGGLYSILMDVFTPFINIFADLNQGNYYYDTTTQTGFDMLAFLFTFSIVFFVIGLVWHLYKESQKLRG